MSESTLPSKWLWPFQELYWFDFQCLARGVFQRLDRQASCEVFLVCFSHGAGDAASVVAGSAFFLSAGVLDGCVGEAAELAGVGVQSEPAELAEREAEHRLRRALCEVVSGRIRRTAPYPAGWRLVAGYPERVGSHSVIPCLLYGWESGGRHPELQRTAAPRHTQRNTEVATSLIHACALVLADLARDELSRANPGSDMALGSSDVENLIRSGCSRLMKDVVFKISERPIGGRQAFLRNTTAISALRYEGETGCGRVVLARQDHPSLQPVISFRTNFQYADTQAIRKLLQLCQGNYLLHTDSVAVYGLVTLQESHNEREDLFTIDILEHHLWELKHNDQALMRVHHGTPQLPPAALDEEKIRRDLRRVFGREARIDTQLLLELLRAAEQQRRGTLLVITPEAESEALRLQGQGTPIQACRLHAELLGYMTSIDGAVILNPLGDAFAIGSILDGVADEKGNRGRGARYNSALRYVNTYRQKFACLAVVVSEDHGMEFIPNLRPAVERGRIDRAVAVLQRQLAAERVERAAYVRARDQLDELRFYLSADDCGALNLLVPQLEERLRGQTGSAFYAPLRGYVPDPDFDPDLHYAADWHCH